MKGIPIQIGYDFGLMPAAVFTQRLPNGQLIVLDELCAVDCGMFRFAESLTQFVAEKFASHEIICWPDPAGNAKSPVNEKTQLEELKGVTPGYWKWGEVQTNDFLIRRDAVINCLNRLLDKPKPASLKPRLELTLVKEPKANTGRYDRLRGKRHVR